MSAIRVADGEMIPTGYGIAWHDAMRLERVCYPIPINLFIYWIREVHFRIMLTLKKPYGLRDRWMRDIFCKAHDLGYRQGYKDALERVEILMIKYLKGTGAKEP